MAIGMVVNSFQRGIASMGRINEIFAAEAKVKQVAKPVKIDESDDNRGLKIEFKDVYFRYASNLPWVLEGINFTLEANESLAILGRTGTGKFHVFAYYRRQHRL